MIERNSAPIDRPTTLGYASRRDKVHRGIHRATLTIVLLFLVAAAIALTASVGST
jgi:hypothetical protein